MKTYYNLRVGSTWKGQLTTPKLREKFLGHPNPSPLHPYTPQTHPHSQKLVKHSESRLLSKYDPWHSLALSKKNMLIS